ncbi:hypothetical protein [Tranquillimonas alkanivorans]|uniref:Uncharacterized protein n=1 Tax=Tranquillimonas alkanivorans TaxID=441119 RepID=A0A1I5U3L5_9RHOB|nr:hypothetical protein [Tranquillimonas alkanivorans]SFP89487.1 hypothetical protein SAMN04488047_11715 [Tranquillimonas alkanivorans]
MTRHIFDHPKTRIANARMRRALKKPGSTGYPHPATLLLQRRGQRFRSASQLREFLRIERGREA